jgi:hypothetical protein
VEEITASIIGHEFGHAERKEYVHYYSNETNYDHEAYPNQIMEQIVKEILESKKKDAEKEKAEAKLKTKNK